MTERVEPMGEMDIEYLVAVVRDHARLVADLEAHRSLSRNQIEQWQHERDALRAELARIRAHIESSHNEVTCSQDARHANDGDDRVPMLTCMTLEAHTLRAEVASLRESEQRIIDGVTETCEAHRLHQTQMRERAEADLTTARERIEKLERIRREAAPLAARAYGTIGVQVNGSDVRGLYDALAALDEETQP